MTKLLIAAVALLEPLAKAVLTSSRTGPRSATTRIPWELVLSSGLVMSAFYAFVEGPQVMAGELRDSLDTGEVALATTLARDRLPGKIGPQLDPSGPRCGPTKS